MLAFVRYELTSFIRSLKFIPPAVLFFAWIFILYAYKNVPILSSYGVSSVALYLSMIWIAMSIFTLEEESEKHILFTHLGSKWRFLIGKWLVTMIVMLPLGLFAIFFPIVSGSFNEGMTLGYYALTFYSHLVFAMFGILVGTLFSATSFAAKKYAWLSAVFVLVCSLASKALIETTAWLKWILWIFPPVFEVITYMGNEIKIDQDFWLSLSFVMGYIVVGVVSIIWLFLNKER